MCRSLILTILSTVVAFESLAQGQEPDLVLEEFTRIKSAQSRARENFSAYFQSEAGKNEDTWPPIIDEFRKTAHANCDLALQLAQKHRDHALSVDILKFVVDTSRGGPSDHSARAFAELQQHHSADAKLGEFLMQKYWISDFRETDSLLQHVANSHPDANQRGYAKYGLARLIMRRCEQKRNYLNEKYLEIDDQTVPGELAMSVDLDNADLEIREILKDLVKNHAEAPLGEADLLGKSADFEIEGYFKLRVGTKVPEITGSDCDGTSFSLADYSGHVRVVIFTGNWCPPCKAMYPQLADLQTKYTDEGLTILGVSTDEELSTLKRAIENKEITWRCWWDKGFGPIVNDFGVTSFPTVLVLDRSGVLRFKKLRGESLVKAVEFLCINDQTSEPDTATEDQSQ